MDTGDHARGLLTSRESTVLAARLRGLAIKEIAEELHLSSHTVRHHSENIYLKLQVHSLQQAICALLGHRCIKCRVGLFARLAAVRNIGDTYRRASFKRRTAGARSIGQGARG